MKSSVSHETLLFVCLNVSRETLFFDKLLAERYIRFYQCTGGIVGEEEQISVIHFAPYQFR